MNYLIIKKIKIEAPTMEEAIQKHPEGQTISLTAEESHARPERPQIRNSAVPISPRTTPAIRSPRA